MNRGLIYERALEIWEATTAVRRKEVEIAQQRLTEAEDRIAYWQAIRDKVEGAEQ